MIPSTLLTALTGVLALASATPSGLNYDRRSPMVQVRDHEAANTTVSASPDANGTSTTPGNAGNGEALVMGSGSMKKVEEGASGAPGSQSLSAGEAQSLAVEGGGAAGTSETVEPPKFGYEGLKAPSGWMGLDPTANSACGKGKEQSPINFEGSPKEGVLATEAERPVLEYPETSGAEFVNKGTTVEVKVSGELTLPQDNSKWELDQFHFHTPSEHRIARKHYPLEMHMVHKKKDDEKQILVLGVVFEISQDGKTQMVQDLMVNVTVIAETGAKTKTGKMNFEAIKEHVKKTDIMTYGGSLTTPPCSEGVRWLVTKEPLPLDVSSYLAAKEVMKFNARNTQNAPGEVNLMESSAKGFCSTQ
ncbi:MAG: hypothetical protein M1832_004308 [Thelocarpon impressellum]|nr:MAG: hypothetical protein M1832_004308 [Thelocarpon impressellum]